MIKIIDVCADIDKKGNIELELNNTIKSSELTKYEYSDFDNKIDACIEIKDYEDKMIVHVHATVVNHDFWEAFDFAKNSPLKLSVQLDKKPDHILSYSLFNDWWTRPYFMDELSGIPARTQALAILIEGETYFIVPFAGEHCITVITGGADGQIFMEIESGIGGMDTIDDVSFVVTRGKNVFNTIKSGMKLAASLKGISTINERKYPEVFKYAGWCSWDAYYTEVSEDKIMEKVAELKEKNVPIRWLLIDDGWLSVKDMKLTSYKPDPEKFPTEFINLTQKIKRDTSIDWIGVWHTIAGYWGGINPDNELPEYVKDNLYKTRNNRLLPHFNEKKGQTFWNEWYAYLSNQGIDFTKVDGQSSLKNHYENSEEIVYAAAHTHECLESASLRFFDGNMINCMGMSSENMLSRPTSSLSRNSDDFVPDDKITFSEHLIQNAYNSLYQGQLYHCDFDMFWTNHKDASKHALLRAMSGGPVYISDKISYTQKDILMRLIYSDGEVIRFDRPPYMPEEDIYSDPECRKIVRLINEHGVRGYFACFTLTDNEMITNFSLNYFHHFKETDAILYNFKKKVYKKLENNNTIELVVNNYELYQLIPCGKNITPVGLTDKYLSGNAILEFTEDTGQSLVVLKEGGEFGFITQKTFKNVQIDGEDSTSNVSERNGIYYLTIDKSNRNLSVTINF